MDYTWNGTEYRNYDDPNNPDVFLALYWRYQVPYADSYDTASDAARALVAGEGNGHLSSVGVVRRDTGEAVCQWTYEDGPAYNARGPWLESEDFDKLDAIEVSVAPKKLA